MGELESTPGPFYSSLKAVERARWVAGQRGSRAAINGAPAILAHRGAASASRKEKKKREKKKRREREKKERERGRDSRRRPRPVAHARRSRVTCGTRAKREMGQLEI